MEPQLDATLESAYNATPPKGKVSISKMELNSQVKGQRRVEASFRLPFSVLFACKKTVFRSGFLKMKICSDEKDNLLGLTHQREFKQHFKEE
jgi:hypothetical protein